MESHGEISTKNRGKLPRILLEHKNCVDYYCGPKSTKHEKSFDTPELPEKSDVRHTKYLSLDIGRLERSNYKEFSKERQSDGSKDRVSVSKAEQRNDSSAVRHD